MPPIPLISVIIPCYNHAHYLPDALDSVLAQTLPDWEAIVVDDGSTDDTAAVAQRYAARDARMRYLHQENRGLSGARNSGIRAARGEFLAFLDADDAWEPQFLEVMTCALSENPASSAVYCGFRYMDADGAVISSPIVQVVPVESFRDTQIQKGNWLACHTVLIRRSLVEDVGLFDESLQACEDADYWYRASDRHAWTGVPQSLARYRRTGNNMSLSAKRMQTALLQLQVKRYGPPDGVPESWPQEKQWAYSRALRLCALYGVASQDYVQAASYVEQLGAIHPDRIRSWLFWKSLSLAHLPVEHRDTPRQADYNRAQRDLMGVIEAIAHNASFSSTLHHQLSVFKSASSLALADLASRQGMHRCAIARLSMSLYQNPRTFVSRAFWYVGLCVLRRLLSTLGRARG